MRYLALLLAQLLISVAIVLLFDFFQPTSAAQNHTQYEFDGVMNMKQLANVGIAMESAGIILVKGDLRGIVRARNLSRATIRNIRQNLAFAFLYNALGIPVAAGVFFPVFGWLLSPMLASAAMSFSDLSVVGNALRLRKPRSNQTLD